MVRNQLAFEEAMRKANDYAWDARWQDAAQQYECALVEFPDDFMAHLNLGMAYLELGRQSDALDHYQRASEITPNDPLPMQKVASIQEQLGQREQAVVNYATMARLWEERDSSAQALAGWQKVVTLAPDNVEAHVQLAKGYTRLDRVSEAANEYLAAAIACRDRGDIEGAIRHCDSALKLDPYQDRARSLRERLSLGQSLQQVRHGVDNLASEQSPLAGATREALGRLAEIIFEAQNQEPVATKDLAAFDRGHQDQSEDARPMADRQQIGTLIGHAIDYQTRGILDKAIDAYHGALELGADYAEIPFSIGVLYYKAMSYDKAIAYLKDSAQVPRYALASHFALGQCYRAEGQLEEALQSYLKLLYALSSEKGASDAEGILQLYSSLIGSHGKVKNQGRAIAFIDALSNFLTGKGWEQRLQQAHEHIKNLATSDVSISLADIVEVSGSRLVLEGLQRSQSYLKQGWPMAAIEECYYILDVAETYLPIHTHLAEIFIQQNKMDQAVAKLSAIASTYEIRGDANQAIATYQRILDLVPLDVAVRPKLISLLTSRGQIDEAIEQHVALADAYYHRIQADKALEKYQEALALAPRGSTERLWPIVLRKKIIQLYSQRLDWNRASAIYEEIKQLGGLSEEEQQELVELYYKASKTGRAEAELDEIIGRLRAERRYPEALDLLKGLVEMRANEVGLRKRTARLLLESGQKDQAVAELDSLGESQLEQGQLDEAIATVKQIIALGPQHVSAYLQLLEQLEGQKGNTGNSPKAPRSADG